MRGSPSRRQLGALLVSAIFFAGCGYSQDEWDRKVQESEELRDRLAAERRAKDKAESDYADALEEIDQLRSQLAEHGLNLDTMSANLESQRSALVEYERRTNQLLETQRRFQLLQKKLEKLTSLGLSVQVRNNRMVIDLPGDVLFESGRERLTDEGKKILLQIAEVLRSDPDLSAREFQVAGHTDDRALRGGPFIDNWGLSAMRARAVVVVLTARPAEGGGGLSADKWSAAGYGSTDPVAPNDTEEGRAKNRRVELVAQPDVAEMLNLNSIAKTGPETERSNP